MIECFIKKVDYFSKHSILGVWQGSEYASGILKLFRHGSKKDKGEHLIYPKFIMVFTLNWEFPAPIFWSHTWKYKIQANESLTKIKEKWSNIQFDSIPMSQTISVINRSGANYSQTHQTNGECAGVCECDRTSNREDWYCLKSVQIWSYFWSVFSCIRIHSECWKIWSRNNSVFGHFSGSVRYQNDVNSLSYTWSNSRNTNH